MFLCCDVRAETSASAGVPLTPVVEDSVLTGFKHGDSGSERGTFVLQDNLGIRMVASFVGLQAEVDTLVLPSSLREIGEYAFTGSRIRCVVLNEGLGTVGKYAFSQMDSLRSISIPSTVVEIDSFTFAHSALESVFLGDNVEMIMAFAFYMCGLREVDLPKTCRVVETYAFEFIRISRISFPEVDAVVAGFAHNLLEPIDVPSNVVELESRAFGWSPLKEVVLREGLKGIGPNAFASSVEGGAVENVATFASVDFPNSLESIGNDAFTCNMNLKRVRFGDALRKNGDYAIGKTGLCELFVPKTVEKYWLRCFCGSRVVV